MKNNFIYLVVSVSGAVVFVLGITGIRLLAPFCGLSLYLWSSSLSIILVSLGLGYWLGGRSRKASIEKMYFLFVIAGIWIALIPWIKNPILNIVEPLGLRFTVIALMIILFSPSFILLGIVNPYSVKLKAAEGEEAGRLAGNFFALSAVSGAAAALMTVYVFMPNISLTSILSIAGSLLVLTSAVGWLFVEKGKKFSGASLLVLCIIIITDFLPAKNSDDFFQGLIAVRQNVLGDIRIIDTENGRYLLLNGGVQNITDESGYISDLHSSAVLDLPKYFFQNPGTMLLLGIGNASLIHQYTGDGWKAEAVEINPDMIDIANEYYRLNKGSSSVEENDARLFLLKTQKKYNIIILNEKKISFLPRLLTEEAFGLMADHLELNGILAVNISAIGWDDPIVGLIGAALKAHFRTVLALPMEEPPDQIGEIVVLASNSGLEPLRKPEINVTLDPEWRYGPGYQKVHAWDNRFVPNFNQVTPLTDDYNPIDVRLDIINNAVREKSAFAFSKKIFSGRY